MIYDSKTDTAKWRRYVYDRIGGIASGPVELGDLSDVSGATATDKNFLIADGSNWASSAHSQDDHSDTTITSPAQDEALVYNASTGKWENTEIAMPSVSCIDGGSSSSTFPEVDVNPFGTTAPTLTIQDEGSSLTTTADILNFVGDGVVASGASGTKTITIAGGSGVGDSSDTEVLFNNSGTGDGIAEFTWDGTNLIFDAATVDQFRIIEGFEIGSTSQSDRARIAPVVNGQSIDLLCSSTDYSGINFKDYVGSTLGYIQCRDARISLLTSTGENAFIGRKNGSCELYYNNVLTLEVDDSGIDVSGNIRAAASTTTISSLRLPHGSAPTSPVDGDMWTTTAGLYVRINGSTVGPLS